MLVCRGARKPRMLPHVRALKQRAAAYLASMGPSATYGSAASSSPATADPTNMYSVRPLCAT